VFSLTTRKELEDNRKLFEDAFLEVYEAGQEFLTSQSVTELCQGSLLYDADADGLRYLLYEFNGEWPMEADLILTDKGRNILYNSFPASDWNQYRSSFHKAICDNSFGIGEGEVHLSVYYLSGSYSEWVLTRPVDVEGQTMGYVSLYLSGLGWANLLSTSNFEGVITDRLGRVIYSSRPGFIQDINKFNPTRKNGVVTLEGQRYLVSESEPLDGEVRIYSLVYDGGNTLIFLLAAGIICILAGCWYLLARSMARAMAASNAQAVGRLLREMDIIMKEDPDHRISLDTGDEFADVALKINGMLDQISTLNRNNTELLELRRTAEIGQLTAQINPHFLYNTLENLRNMLVFDPATADKLIIKLTEILRYSIDDREEMVPFRRDLGYLESYLDIQKCRYGDRFCYEVSPEESCGDCLVPRLVLQPIVENSIKYGFRSQMELHIWIDGYRRGDLLILSVTDDGPGLEQAALEALNRSLRLADQTPSQHKGLRNIARRLYLQYGGESGVQVRNQQGGGLQVILRIAQQPQPELTPAAKEEAPCTVSS
jgi:sensor histidine kinase YesM